MLGTPEHLILWDGCEPYVLVVGKSTMRGNSADMHYVEYFL